MEQSTATTIFWTLDQMKEMGTELAIASMHPISACTFKLMAKG
jgi:hypothetical protein